MDDRKCVVKERKRGKLMAPRVSQGCQALKLAGYCKKLSWCYTNLPIMTLVCELAFVLMMFIVLFKIYYLFTLLLLLLFVALDAAVNSFPQRTNTLFCFSFKPNK